MRIKKYTFITSILILIILFLIFNPFVREKINGVLKINKNMGNNGFQFDIEVISEDESSYQCLIKFTSNDISENIKKIEYPNKENQEGQVITISSENGTDSIAIDYKFSKDDIDKDFLVTTINDEEIQCNTAYTISYNANGIFKCDYRC